MSLPIHLDGLQAAEDAAVASLLQRSLMDWYERNLGQGARFGGSAAPFRRFPELYRHLDPQGAIAARSETGELLGVCFHHARETHHSIGIVATSPEAAGRGVARAMVSESIRRAEAAGKPLRLVSSLMNLDSFSLYTRLGFVPGELYQDLFFRIPAEGFAPAATAAVPGLRLARPEDAVAIADFECGLRGIRREGDIAHFLADPQGPWRVWLVEDGAGRLQGYLAAHLDPELPMLGPGAAVDPAAAQALAATALDAQRGREVVLLAPAAQREFIATLYAWGGRNVELHAAQVRGRPAEAAGIAFPTFFPESA
jgi:ribosomal protein S18 acetylase RimI-like enzyme